MSNKTVMCIGSDGYIGNALTQRLLKEGHKVIGVDNFLRRFWIKHSMKSFSALPILDMNEKLDRFNQVGEYIFYEVDIVKNQEDIKHLIEIYKPDTIVNLAHIPSGPYSHISQDNANLTLTNNMIGTNNILWNIKEVIPDCHYITIGTTGEYDHYSNIDIEEGYFQITHHGRLSKEIMYPRRPGSIYHVSKTASTYLIDFLCRTWDLKCTDVQQSIVFGAYTDEIDESKIYSRYDTDEAGGTIVNRFIMQAVLGIPLTIYGEGKHQRGFLSLNDSVQALMIAVNNTPECGHVQSWNQLSSWHSMNDIADMVINVGKKFDLNVEKNYIKSLRTEYTGHHYYKYITKNLTSLGYIPTRTIEQEIEYVFNTLIPLKDELYPLKDVVMPKIKWSK